jgi:ABC-2 type transport system ATP-binding protein
MNYILRVESISKDFSSPLSLWQLCTLDFKRREPIRVLQNISFSLERNKILCILGPNGAGKTTLLKIISTLILPDKGKVFVNGSCHENRIKAMVGLLLNEERSFYWRLSGRQNLEFFSSLYGIDRKTTTFRINSLLDFFGVDYADKRFDSYSTGMKKKLALMRCLLHSPQLLLLDELTQGLDYSSSMNLKNFIKQELFEKQGKTVIFTTHNMDEAECFGEIFLILHKGIIYGQGTLDELRAQTGDHQAKLSEIFLKLTKNQNDV